MNVSSVPWSLICKDESKHLAELEGKLANICNDISTNVDDSAIGKRVISGEPISVRRLYQNPRVMCDYARMLFACNELPATNDFSHGWFRRLLIVPFTVEIPAERQDPLLAQRIIETELPGVFCWILEGARRLLRQKAFTQSPNVERQLQEYRRTADNVASFVSDKGYITGRDESMPLAAMYASYQDFCREGGHRSCSKTKFSARLRGLKLIVENGTGNVLTVYYSIKSLYDNELPF